MTTELASSCCFSNTFHFNKMFPHSISWSATIKHAARRGATSTVKVTIHYDCLKNVGNQFALFHMYHYANAQSINNKMDEFREVVTVLKPKVIGIIESCSEGKSEGVLIWKVLPHTEMIVEDPYGV